MHTSVRAGWYIRQDEDREEGWGMGQAAIIVRGDGNGLFQESSGGMYLFINSYHLQRRFLTTVTASGTNGFTVIMSTSDFHVCLIRGRI